MLPKASEKLVKKGPIQLEYPYSEDWDKGTVVINPENRRNILLGRKKPLIAIEITLLLVMLDI